MEKKYKIALFVMDTKIHLCQVGVYTKHMEYCLGLFCV